MFQVSCHILSSYPTLRICKLRWIRYAIRITLLSMLQKVVSNWIVLLLWNKPAHPLAVSIICFISWCVSFSLLIGVPRYLKVSTRSNAHQLSFNIGIVIIINNTIGIGFSVVPTIPCWESLKVANSSANASTGPLFNYTIPVLPINFITCSNTKMNNSRDTMYPVNFGRSCHFFGNSHFSDHIIVARFQ